MSFLELPRELRDKVYKELLVEDEALDIRYLLGANEVYSRQRRRHVLDLAPMNTCHQIRQEFMALLSETGTFKIYDDSLKLLEKLFGETSFQMLREPLSRQRLRVAQQVGPYTLRVRHLHIDINSSTPDSDSAHRLMLRALLALAHEADGEGFVSIQPDEWRSSLAAYVTATILPPASQLRSITINVSGFLHSESKHLLLEVVSRLYVLGNIAFRFQLAGKREDEVLFGRQAIDRTVLELTLSKACGCRVVVPKHDFLPPRSRALASRLLVC